MKRIIFAHPVFLLAAAMLAGGAAKADEPPLNTLSKQEGEAGWRLLFDGRTTEGWRGYAQTNFPKQGWVVENGCLKNEGHHGHKGGGDIVTIETFDDFDFKFEWRISPAGNSGVKYFVQEGKTGHSGIGCEYQLLDDQANEDASNGPNRQTGALYALIAPNSHKHLKPVGEWNESEIKVQGNHIEHWLNGGLVVEFEAGSAALKAAIAQSKFSKVSGFGDKRKTFLLLQDHGDPVWFRNLKIRPARH